MDKPEFGAYCPICNKFTKEFEGTDLLEGMFWKCPTCGVFDCNIHKDKRYGWEEYMEYQRSTAVLVEHHEGECRRCGRDFTDPAPEVTNPGGNKEVVCVGWCPDCNKLATIVLYRERTAYYEKGVLHDPLKGGYKCQ